MYDMSKCAEKLSANLKELRKHGGFTQKNVADGVGITYQSYQAYERKISYPSLPVLIAIAEFYDVTLDYLVGRKEY